MASLLWAMAEKRRCDGLSCFVEDLLAYYLIYSYLQVGLLMYKIWHIP